MTNRDLPPVPTYIDTDRTVAAGDRGACTIKGAGPGIVTSLRLVGEGSRWDVSIQWPNLTTVDVPAHELYWVEPETLVELYLTDEWLERLADTREANTQMKMALWVRVREAAGIEPPEEPGHAEMPG